MERLKDEFVSTVSHELRTPLTSISGSLGLLVGQWAGKLPEPAARLLGIAHKNSQRLVRLVNDILDIEKIEVRPRRIQLCRVDVVRWSNKRSRAIADLPTVYGVRVRFDAASADAEVNADPDRLAQVITNLLSNAIKFSPWKKRCWSSWRRMVNWSVYRCATTAPVFRRTSSRTCSRNSRRPMLRLPGRRGELALALVSSSRSSTGLRARWGSMTRPAAARFSCRAPRLGRCGRPGNRSRRRAGLCTYLAL